MREGECMRVSVTQNLCFILGTLSLGLKPTPNTRIHTQSAMKGTVRCVCASVCVHAPVSMPVCASMHVLVYTRQLLCVC